MTGEFLPLSNDSICCLQHIFDEDAKAARGIVDENVGHRADELTILNDGTAAHE